jgi:RNA polymerase sigma-70 factor (ECF subfamily)
VTVGASDKAIGLQLGTVSEEQHDLARVRAGEEAAIVALYTAHHVQLRAFARHLVGDPQAAEDLVHDVFVELPRVVNRYRGEEGQWLGFLRGIAVNRARHHVRAAMRRRAAMHRLERELEAEAGFGSDEVERRALSRQLMLALDRLPLPQRIAFVLCEIEELTASEAAELTGAPVATRRTRNFHAKRRLRELLGGVR